jgi:predicted DCC family thiol-disulfide oxidoreductase YuxK
MNPARPLLIFDGDCSFCRRWITRWEHLTGDAIDYEPSQTAAERFPQIPREEFGKAVFLIEPDGTITRGAAAVFRSLAHANRYRLLLWLYEHIGFFALISETLYSFIARHRDGIDRIDRIVVGTETRPATHSLTRAVFLRGLGAIYLIAFLSLFIQIDGLVGSRGILPAKDYLWHLPTLAHFSTSDAFLHGMCITGIICSCGLIIGATPLLMTIVLWTTYLSLVIIGQDFLGFQWDALLLETGLLAILWSPPLWVSAKTPPSRVVLILYRWLIFRLMFLSALTKWLWNDDCWRDMTALKYHFETQPLPIWSSWYAHHNPMWMLKTSCAIMFFIEGIVPFLFFFPRRTRMLACWLTILLQVMIMATGNYGFFNILAILLCIPLLDDPAIAKLLRRGPRPPLHGRPIVRMLIVWPMACVIFLLTTMALLDTRPSGPRDWWRPLEKLQMFAEQFRSTNSYGLFRVMTRDRPEIIVEGSDDGQNWKPYTFKYKEGDVDRRPTFCEPHMPRLDWQMWFAALEGSPRQWFVNFVIGLLEGRREVTDLLADNPFPNAPPKYVRAVLYDYRFSPVDSKDWWVRKPVRLFLPPVSLQRQKAIDQSFRL